MAKITEKQAAMITYFQGVSGVELTADEVAEGMGISKQAVTGSYNSLEKKELANKRVEREITLADGTHKTVKFLSLSDAGLAIDPVAASQED